MKILTSRTNLVRAIFEFDRIQDMRLRIKEVEQHIASQFGGKCMPTASSDDDPNAPKFFMKGGDIQAIMSQVMLDVGLLSAADDKQIDLDQFKVLANNIYKSFGLAINEVSFTNIAMVTSISFPIDITVMDADIHNFLFQKFYSNMGSKIATKNNAVEAQIRYGFRTEDQLNCVLNIAPYEIRNITNETGATKLVLKITDYPVSERGIEVIIDTNYKEILKSSTAHNDPFLKLHALTSMIIDQEIKGMFENV